MGEEHVFVDSLCSLCCTDMLCREDQACTGGLFALRQNGLALAFNKILRILPVGYSASNVYSRAYGRRGGKPRRNLGVQAKANEPAQPFPVMRHEAWCLDIVVGAAVTQK